MRIRFQVFLIFLLAATACTINPRYAVIISANAEWKAIRNSIPAVESKSSPWGDYFTTEVAGRKVLFFHEGWGKVAAAGGTQYVIDRFDPEFLINLGTCGGIEGQIKRFETVLADRTIIYDIQEAMGDSKEAIDHYSTAIDLSWLRQPYPVSVRKTVLVSADKDLRSEELAGLSKNYDAVAGDWESGAIAHVAARNDKKLLILRGVSDVVSQVRGEAYGNPGLFVQRTDTVMRNLLRDLPLWIKHIEKP